MKKFLCGLLVILMLSCTGCNRPQVEEIESADSPDSNLTVTVMDIGKADAILLQTEQHTVMIDCGEEEDWEKVSKQLEQLQVSQIDLLILTHLDKDHIGGASHVIQNYDVKEIVQSHNDETSQEYMAYQNACEAQNLRPKKLRENAVRIFGKLELNLLPCEKESYKDDNNYSVITEAEYGKNSFLFVGDAEKKRLKEYMTGNSRTFNFLKVPHHGKLESNSEEFFAAVSPQYAVITCSEKNPPDREVVELLKTAGADVYLTYHGTVRAVSDGENLTVTQTK